VAREDVDEVVPCQPAHCRRCGRRLTGGRDEPVRPQVVGLPLLTPHVTAYQFQRGQCARCGVTAWGQLPAGVPGPGGGPRLARLIALFCREVVGLPRAVGAVCQRERTVKRALRPAVQQARADVRSQDTNSDGTPWKEWGRRRWLWAAVTPAVRAFQIAPARGAPVLAELLGKADTGVVTSDRAKAYAARPLQRGPLGWAH
jgi:transposase